MVDKFKDFCILLENIGSPSEARIQIAEYLRYMTPGEQTIACNFLLGSPLEGDKIGYGKRVVEKVLTDRYGLELSGKKSLGEEFRRVQETRHSNPFSTLSEIYDKYLKLSKTSTDKERTLYLQMIDLPDIQKHYFVDIMLDKLQARIGFGVIKHSLAMIYDTLITDIEYAYKMTNSISKTIKFLNGQEISSEIGTPINPQLAKDISNHMNRLSYPVQVEGKYDGVRSQIHVHDDGHIQIFSRQMKETTEQFPDICMILQAEGIKPGIYDSEIYGINEDFSPLSFEKFQKRLGVKNVTEALIKEFPATVVIFDILYNKNGEHRFGQFQRSQALEGLTSYWSPWRIVDNKEELMKSFEHAIQMGYEGLMIKDMHAQYAPGEGKTNWKNWFKFKPNQTADVVIIDGQLGTGDRKDVLASFTIAVMKEAGVLYPIGNVGSGFTIEELETLTMKADIMTGIQNADMVIEVRFDKVSVNEAGEYAFRFPRFVRFRPDKMIHEIDTLDMVKEYLK